MSSEKKKKIKPQRPRGFEDLSGNDLVELNRLRDSIQKTYSLYGFDALETGIIEYSDVIGSFLPDQDRPNEGVFSFEDDDNKWVSLRYDLTSGLARYVAENYDSLPKPYRRYQSGWVFRNEKPGPGRYRQFFQIDADTIGSDNALSDAEMCMMFSDAIENTGIERGNFIIRLNNRKILDGIIDSLSISGNKSGSDINLAIMRSIDKLDRLGLGGVEQLLGDGRKDESGDYTKGAGLDSSSIKEILLFLESGIDSKHLSRKKSLENLSNQFGSNSIFAEAIEELDNISSIIDIAKYDEKRIIIDPSVVRGLGYYTGPVYEADLTFDIETDDSIEKFGSVGGGGRYDDLITRLKGARVPSTGISVGVSRLSSALKYLKKQNLNKEKLSVVVLVMDKEKRPLYYKIASELRSAGVPSECYAGDGGMKAQLKYADKREARFALILGEDEEASNNITIKDLLAGKEASDKILDNEEWRSGKVSQKTIPIEKLIVEIKSLLES
ncbi:histidine--tRNA ligase [bacterium]|nr:histidine--tRNA ligase [bacterium]